MNRGHLDAEDAIVKGSRKWSSKIRKNDALGRIEWTK